LERAKEKSRRDDWKVIETLNSGNRLGLVSPLTGKPIPRWKRPLFSRNL
jgi:hypothetical protein